MIKFRRLLCVVLVCALVGVAYGAARKIRSFTPMGAENATADGMAILNLADGGVDGARTIIQVVLSDFTPDTTYIVGIVPPWAPSPYPDEIGQFPYGVWPFIDAITTDQNGNGTLHVQVPGDMSLSNIAVYLYLRDADGVVSAPPGGFLRALGNL